MRVRNLLYALVCFTVSAASYADVIASNIDTTPFVYGSYYVGQSFSVGGTGTYNDIVFNFYGGSGTDPLAFGRAYLLSAAYAGTPAGLSTSTPGFLASAAAGGNYYTFGGSLALQSGTTYFVFTDTLANVHGTHTTEGQTFYVSGAGESFNGFTNQSATYTVTGDPVNVVPPVVAATPEPSSLALLATGVTGVIGAVRRKRAGASL